MSAELVHWQLDINDYPLRMGLYIQASQSHSQKKQTLPTAWR